MSKMDGKMSKNRKLAVGVVIGLMLAAVMWLVATPYLTLHGIRRAIAAQDAGKVSEYIDFQALRESVKAQSLLEVQRRSGGRMTARQAAVIAAGADRLIDAVIRPELITLVLADNRSSLNPLGGRFDNKDIHVRRTAIDRFEVRGSRPGALIFDMRGLGWKLVGVSGE